jgi:hypothetical protein
MDFLDSLITFNSDGIPERKWNKLKTVYLNDEKWDQEKI